MKSRFNPIKFLENPFIPWLIAAFFALIMILIDIFFRIQKQIPFDQIENIRHITVFLYLAPLAISILIMLFLLFSLRWKRALVTLISILAMVVILFVPQCTLTRTQEILIDKSVKGSQTPFNRFEQQALIQNGLSVLSKDFPRESITNYHLFVSNHTWFFRLESTRGNAQTDLRFLTKAFAKKSPKPPLSAKKLENIVKTILLPSLSPFISPHSLQIQSITLEHGYKAEGFFISKEKQKIRFQQSLYFRKNKIWPDYPYLSPSPEWQPLFLSLFEQNIKKSHQKDWTAGPIAHTLHEKKLFSFEWKQSSYLITSRIHVFHHDQTRPEVVFANDTLLYRLSPDPARFILALKERVPQIQTNRSQQNFQLNLIFQKVLDFQEKRSSFLILSNKVLLIQ